MNTTPTSSATLQGFRADWDTVTGRNYIHRKLLVVEWLLFLKRQDLGPFAEKRILDLAPMHVGDREQDIRTLTAIRDALASCIDAESKVSSVNPAVSDFARSVAVYGEAEAIARWNEGFESRVGQLPPEHVADIRTHISVFELVSKTIPAAAGRHPYTVVGEFDLDSLKLTKATQGDHETLHSNHITPPRFWTVVQAETTEEAIATAYAQQGFYKTTTLNQPVSFGDSLEKLAKDLTLRLRLAGENLRESEPGRRELSDGYQHYLFSEWILSTHSELGDDIILEQIVTDFQSRFNKKMYKAKTIDAAVAFFEKEVVKQSDLIKLFGPQAREILTFARAFRTLTQDQLSDWASLHAEINEPVRWGIGPYFAANAARDLSPKYLDSSPANDLMRGILSAKHHENSMYGNGSESRAAQAVVNALQVRHFIGIAGFEQRHYDVSTAAWRTVVGRLHPEDPELSVESQLA